LTVVSERRGVGIGDKRLACRRAALDAEGIGHVLADHSVTGASHERADATVWALAN